MAINKTNIGNAEIAWKYLTFFEDKLDALNNLNAAKAQIELKINVKNENIFIIGITPQEAVM